MDTLSKKVRCRLGTYKPETLVWWASPSTPTETLRPPGSTNSLPSTATNDSSTLTCITIRGSEWPQAIDLRFCFATGGRGCNTLVGGEFVCDQCAVEGPAQ